VDKVGQRLLHEETIPAHEKMFSLFEPHTEWIQKGKQRPNVELGHKLLLATDQQQLIQDWRVCAERLSGPTRLKAKPHRSSTLAPDSQGRRGAPRRPPPVHPARRD
jgi:hypothetical protein